MSWCNSEFPYGKDPCLKRASKGIDKKNQNHVKGKGNCYLEQVCLQGSSWAELQSYTSWGFHRRSLHLAAICLPPPVLSKQLCLFAISPTPFCKCCGCFVLFQNYMVVICSGLRSILMQMWSQKFWHIMDSDWKKAEWVRRKKSETEQLHHTTKFTFTL